MPATVCVVPSPQLISQFDERVGAGIGAAEQQRVGRSLVDGRGAAQRQRRRHVLHGDVEGDGREGRRAAGVGDARRDRDDVGTVGRNPGDHAGGRVDRHARRCGIQAPGQRLALDVGRVEIHQQGRAFEHDLVGDGRDRGRVVDRIDREGHGRRRRGDRVGLRAVRIAAIGHRLGEAVGADEVRRSACRSSRRPSPGSSVPNCGAVTRVKTRSARVVSVSDASSTIRRGVSSSSVTDWFAATGASLIGSTLIEMVAVVDARLAVVDAELEAVRAGVAGRRRVADGPRGGIEIAQRAVGRVAEQR